VRERRVYVKRIEFNMGKRVWEGEAVIETLQPLPGQLDLTFNDIDQECCLRAW
jgi:hypothetical protein